MTVEADDRNGGIAAIDVTIHVADVNEPPEAPARPRVEPASSTSLTVTWTEPANTGPGIDGYDVQYRTGSGNFIPWPHNSADLTATITNLTPGASYEVRVRATNDEGTGAWSPSGVGTTHGRLISVCDRVPPIREAIVNAIPGVDACGDVSASHLASIVALDVRHKDATGLDADDFAGLTGMEDLVLEHVDIGLLPNAVFSGLISLKKIKIYDAFLSELNAGIFAGLPALETLDLRANFLTTLPAGVFSMVSSLKTISLWGNRLSSVDVRAFSGLPTLRNLSLAGNQFSTLPENVFSNLPALETLYLSYNRFSTLPEGVFSGLETLKRLDLVGNPVDPLPIMVSLERAGAGQFKAKAHTGAPFVIVLPISVANGAIDGGTSNITIHRGRVESDVLRVSRTAGATSAVSVDIERLPAPPQFHQGYTLVKSTADLPLVVLE